MTGHVLLGLARPHSASTAYVGRGIHGQTVEALATSIIHGEIHEESRIDPSTLRVELGVSMTVVREALKVLAAKGMIGSRQKRGTFVRPRSDWVLLDPDVLRWRADGPVDQALLTDLQEFREITEPAMARLAAERADHEDVAGLESAMADLTHAGGDPEATAVADVSFHRALLAAAHNQLIRQLDVVIISGLAMRDYLVHRHEDNVSPVPAHQAVQRAVCNGDAAGAEAAMRELLLHARLSLDVVLAELVSQESSRH